MTAEIADPGDTPIRLSPDLAGPGPVSLRRTDVTVASPDESRREARAAARQAEVTLQLIAITLLWLVLVSLLLGFGLTTHDAGTSNVLAALVAVVLPFAGAVLATKARMPILGGVYAALTLAAATLVVLVPALGLVWWMT